MMNKNLVRLSVTILSLVVPAILIMFSGCTDPGSPIDKTFSVANRLEVYYSVESPRWDDPQDEIWKEAVTGSIHLGKDGYPNYFDTLKCQMNAVVANDSIFIRAQWIDLGRSIWPNYLSIFSYDLKLDTVSTDPLEVDTTKINVVWARKPTLLITDPDSNPVYYWNDQDRFALIWDMGNNGDEGADCMTMCHDVGHGTTGHKMYTTEGGQVDVWQWLAATSDGLLKSRDEIWNSEGRASDQGDSLVKSNFGSEDRPLFARPSGPGHNEPFLFSDNVVEFDTSLEWSTADVVPGYVLQKNASGSITDVSGYSHYSTNAYTWSIVMARPLNSGNADDLDLSQVQPGDSVMISIAVMSNADRVHSGSKPFYVIF